MKTLRKNTQAKAPVKKPVVHYSHVSGLRVGHNAYVQPIDHTSAQVTNSSVVVTSTVLSHNPHSGEFETMNSIYRPQVAEICAPPAVHA